MLSGTLVLVDELVNSREKECVVSKRPYNPSLCKHYRLDDSSGSLCSMGLIICCTVVRDVLLV